MHPSEILFWGILSFLLGIVAASLEWSAIALVGMVAACAIAAIALGKLKKTAAVKYALFFGVCAFLGAFYFNTYLNIKAFGQKIEFGKEISFSGIIMEEPHRFERHQYFGVRLSEPYSGKIRIISSPAIGFKYGDAIKAVGIINPQDSPVTPGESPFPKISVIAEHQGFWLKEKLLEFKSGLISRIIEFLPINEGALLAGITLGDRSHITSDFKTQMADSGTTHLVALSGYNIAIIAIVISKLLGNTVSRRNNFYLTNLIILAFVAMVGAEPSVVRAALMAFLVLLAREAGRMYDIKNAIAIAAGAMAIANPVSLVYDIGFQLSFASLLGIVYLSPAVTKLFRQQETISGWRESVIITLSAQLAVVPIALHSFGIVSLLAVVANVLILQFMPPTMFFGFILAGLGQISHYAGFVVAKIVQPLLAYEVWVIETFSAISVPMRIHFSFGFSILYYTALALMCAVIKNKSAPKTATLNENGK